MSTLIPSAAQPRGGLILLRRVGESVVIRLPGGDVTIRVEQVQGSAARLRFIAPASIPIYRQELLDSDYRAA